MKWYIYVVRCLFRIMYSASFYKWSSDSRCLKLVAVEGEETSTETSPDASDVGSVCYVILFILLNNWWRYPYPGYIRCVNEGFYHQWKPRLIALKKKTPYRHLGGKVLHKYSLKSNVFESFVSSIMKEAYISYGLFTHGLFNGAR